MLQFLVNSPDSIADVIATTAILWNILMILGRTVHEFEKACCVQEQQLQRLPVQLIWAEGSRGAYRIMVCPSTSLTTYISTICRLTSIISHLYDTVRRWKKKFLIFSIPQVGHWLYKIFMELQWKPWSLWQPQGPIDLQWENACHHHNSVSFDQMFLIMWTCIKSLKLAKSDH